MPTTKQLIHERLGNAAHRVQNWRTATQVVQESQSKVLQEKKQDLKDEPLEKSFIQYIKQGNTFSPAGRVTLHDKLANCPYEIQLTMSGPVFERVKPTMDEVLVFENSPMNGVVKEIDRFWSRKEAYDRLGLMHNRGILMYGPPGTGKSICLQQVVEMMADRGDVVFFVKSPEAIIEGMKAFRQIEPTRKVVVSFEEADEMCRYNERAMLRLMDGDAKINGVLFLACVTPEHRILTQDLCWVCAGDIKTGDKLWAFEEHNKNGQFGRRYEHSSVVSSFPAKKQCVRVFFETGESFTCSEDHPWLAFRGGDKGHSPHEWVIAKDLMKYKYFCFRPFETWKAETSFDAGWLSGIMDGEGCVSGGRENRKCGIGITQAIGQVADKIISELSKYCQIRVECRKLGGHYKDQMRLYVTNTSIPSNAQVLGKLRPIRLITNFDMAGARVECTSSQGGVQVVAVEPTGLMDIQSIETSTKTYFGEGFAMHNTTNYIDRLPERMLRPGRFDKKIYIGMPKYEHRLKYLSHKLKDMEQPQQIAELAKQSDGMGFGHLRELIAGVYAIGDPLDEVLRRLKSNPHIGEGDPQAIFAPEKDSGMKTVCCGPSPSIY